MMPLVETAVRFAVKNAPKILATIGICGVAGTAVMAAKAAPEAKDILEKYEYDEDKTPFQNNLEKVKAVAPVYAPAVGMGVLTVTSFLGAQHILSTRQAAAAIAATIAESTLKDYQEEVLKKVGKKKALEIREEVSKKKLEEAPSVDEAVVEHTGNGNTLCYDVVTGRYFRSSMEEVRKAENTIVKLCADEMAVCLNVFYEELGLRPCKYGYMVGWRIDGVRPDMNFTTHLKDGEPVLTIDYTVDNRLRY